MLVRSIKCYFLCLDLLVWSMWSGTEIQMTPAPFRVQPLCNSALHRGRTKPQPKLLKLSQPIYVEERVKRPKKWDFIFWNPSSFPSSQINHRPVCSVRVTKSNVCFFPRDKSFNLWGCFQNPRGVFLRSGDVFSLLYNTKWLFIYFSSCDSRPEMTVKYLFLLRSRWNNLYLEQTSLRIYFGNTEQGVASQINRWLALWRDWLKVFLNANDPIKLDFFVSVLKGTSEYYLYL